MTETQQHSFEGSNIKGIRCSGFASAEYILINFIAGCLADLKRI